MNLYDKASLILTPNAYKASKLYALKPTNGSGDFTFSRASAKRRRNASGVLEALANNVPALEYPVGGGCPVWNFEPQRTNLALHSSDPSQTAWVKARIDTASTILTTPLLGINATRLTVSSAGAVRSRQVLTGLSAGNNYAYQCLVKRGNTDNITTLISDTGEVVNSVINYNFANNTFAGENPGVRYLVSRKADAISDGWVLISLILNVPSGQTTLAFNTFMPGSNSTGAIGETMLIANTGVELGSFVTSPIVTAGAAATRVGDGISALINSALFGVSSCTWFIHVRNNIAVANDGTHIAGPYISNGTQGLYLATTTSGRLRLWTVAASAVFSTTDDEVKLAVVCNGTTVDVFQNGVKVISGYSYAFSFNRIGSFAPNIPLSLQGMHLYPSVLSDAECIALTTL